MCNFEKIWYNIIIKGSKGIIDAYLSDLHYTEEAAIYH